MISQLIIIAVLVSPARGGSVSAVAYYVSASTGNDAAAGTSALSAWKTLARAAQQPLNDGAALLLNAGDSWSEPLTVQGTGSATLPLQIGVYGGVRRPTIVLPGAGACLTASDTGSVSITGLELRGGDTGIVALRTNVSIVDVLFADLWNRSYVGQGVPGTCGNGWTPSVAVGAAASVTVVNSVFSNIDVAFWPFGPVTTVRFLNNTVVGANGNTIFFVASHDWLLQGCVFSHDNAPRFFPCGTTDIMIGGSDTRGAIRLNEIGWRGENIGAPDGCAIDYEGGSDGVQIVDNFIHDAYGAGIMVFGLSDSSRNISNAIISDNIFLRNGGGQTSDDHGEIAFMEFGSTGTCVNNSFYSLNPDPAFVLRERVPGILAQGWTVAGNSIAGLDHLELVFAPPPAIANVQFNSTSGDLLISFVCRIAGLQPSLRVTLDGSWPAADSPAWTIGQLYPISRSSAVNARFFVSGLLPSPTTTYVAVVPAASA